jgi:leader peptidase (prepilin peptidase)/N-methyltransferase
VPSLLVIAATTFGAAAGAFLPHPAHRLAVPFGTPARKICATCARPVRHGFVRVGPACACKPTRWIGPVVISAATTGLLAVVLGATPLLPVLLPAAIVAVLLAMIDMRCLRLPDPLVATLAALTVLPLAVTGAPPRCYLAALTTGLAYLLLALLPGGGLGLGDVKLAAILGFTLGYLGWPAVLIGTIAPHLINGPIALALLATSRATRRSPIPFGPSLLLGTLIALTVAT